MSTPTLIDRYLDSGPSMKELAACLVLACENDGEPLCPVVHAALWLHATGKAGPALSKALEQLVDHAVEQEA